jgi:hypothetical protein
MALPLSGDGGETSPHGRFLKVREVRKIRVSIDTSPGRLPGRASGKTSAWRAAILPANTQ